ncbi:MAG: VOC family protein [Proteobacteria bacterium]|nr:VOC family protein [Pseudomonadota bacterium]
MDDQTAAGSGQDAPAEIHPKSYKGKSHIKVNKLGHMVYEVSDIERTVKFWTEVMGFEETDRNDIGMVFFRCGADHHAIGLKPGKKKRRPGDGDGMQMEHLALEVDNIDVLFKARDFLRENNIPIVFEGRKGAGCNTALNFKDPDGYEFEIYCTMDQIDETGSLRPKELFRRAASLEEAKENPVSKTW